MSDTTPEKKPVSKLVENEQKTLEFWTKQNIFEKSLEQTKKGKEFIFYDGPPFATGLPHYGHILASTLKDVIPRYKTMQGFHVPRKWGWDCHGLPVENLVEKELNLETKKDIENYGIDTFNKVAEESVLRYAKDWREAIPRFGRWVDMDNDYRTMDSGYTESVWWVFKNLFDKKLIYEGFKVMHLCPRCETTLSNFEVNLGYKDIADISVFVKFKMKEEENTYFLAWTTTPWTLPGNVALAVGKDIEYVKVVYENTILILAKERLNELFANKEHMVLSTVKGSELVGLSYVPLFSYYDIKSLKNRENGFKVYGADFVTTTDGSGIVHIAPAFGEDDMKLGQAYSLPFIQHVGTDGKFKKEVTHFAGLDVKPKEDHQKSDVEMVKYLAHNNFLFEKKKINHSYPHCWRCNTPLLNYASSSWFVKVTAFKDKLVKANKKVSWTPKEVGEGRFGNWLLGARDWAISRSRFWGAPLPVWRSEDGEVFVPGSLKELVGRISSRNNYLVIRHGEAENNILGVYSSLVSNTHHLTTKGKAQVKASGRKLRKENIDIVVYSPLARTRETAEIVREALGLSRKECFADERLREFDAGDLNNTPITADGVYFANASEFAHKKFPNGESRHDVLVRTQSLLQDLEKKYAGKKILLITHGTPSSVLKAGAENTSLENLYEMNKGKDQYLGNAEYTQVAYKPLPLNQKGEIDLHRPYIDSVTLVSSKGKIMYRIPEVFDCWFESGSMPYGQHCFTGTPTKDFNPKGGFFKKPIGFPADFIAEGLDQTRGWFYVMMVLGVALFNKSPYKNVIVNGIILAENGEKMSKSLKNYPDPMLLINQYGADALRYYMLSSPVVSAQDLAFSEKGVDEVSKKLLQRLDNVVTFYELYADGTVRASASSPALLDKWILSRLSELGNEVTSRLDVYELDKATRPFMDFVDDLSTWYLRRSRDRFKSGDETDKKHALATTRYVLIELSKLFAPFVPFYAEYLYQKVKEGHVESVHLEKWTEYKPLNKSNLSLLTLMKEVRDVVSVGLEQRAKANIKVRQPLSSAILAEGRELPQELLDLVRDELNVKTVSFGKTGESKITLDLTITPELKAEGDIRELIRAIQDLRKKEGLTVSDRVALLLEADKEAESLVSKYKQEIMKVTLVSDVVFEIVPNGETVKVGEKIFILKINK